MSTAKVVDVIIRKTAEKTKLTGEGNLSVSISSPSVIEIQGSAQDVVRYVRQGNDLLIYMKDGSVIRCNNYFVEDTETHNHSELVFNDNQELTHISFADAGEASGVAATELTAQAAPISSIEPFLEQGSVLSDAPWGWIAGAALGGGAIGALLAHGGDGETKTKVIDNTKEVESATPTFLLTDNAGDKQGVLSAKAVTDDNTPTFSGTGQPGATIQVKDGSGSTIASTMVAKDGTWTVTLPTQADGEHTWSVVQIDGSKTTSAGSITVTVSTADASVTLATTAGDNVINASEQSAGFTLSGTSKNLAQGTALTVTLNGKTYSAEVGANGAWSVKVPAADAQALGDGTWTVNVSGKDAAGNTVSGSQTIGVDTASPVISVDTIAQDNIINAAEHNQPLTLTGKTDAEAGQIVTVTLNGKNHTATVGSDGTWSVTLPASEVQALANGEHTLTVNVSDKAGNGSSVTADFTVDTAAPGVTINTVAGDDILNTSEQGQAQIISGQANGAAAGDVVTVTVGGKTFTGVVQADGSWSVGVPASVIGALGEGSHSISVSVTDAAGNTGSATHGITLSGNPPEFTLDPISQDNVLNAQEAMQPLSLSGTSNLPNGSAVTVTLNNVNYQATVENGRWSVQVPVSDVLDLANTLYTVSVSGTDSVGNSGSAEANLLVDTVLPQVIVNTFAGDNLVNNAEAAVDQTLSGRVTGAAAGDTVSVTVGGKSYTATVGSDLKWSVTIPSADLQAFGDGDLTFSASVTNAHGNTGTGERDININAELPGLRVNTISGDDVINAIEQQQDLAVTGSSTHLAEGTQITVTINNVEYVTTVNASGNWQIGVPAADLQAWTAGGMTVSVSAEDAWGNTVAAEHPIELDLNAVAVTIDTVTTDDMLNAAEKGADVTLSGQTQGVEAGQTVVVKFADQTFTAQVQQDGSWHLTVPASAMETLIDGRAQVSVSVTNVNGNSADASRVVIVDTQPPAITLDNLTDDNIINAAEAQQDLVLSGSTTAEAGQTVTVTLNGKSYQTTVQADGRWQLNVPAADVGALTDGNVTVTATVSDVAGNSSSADRVGLVDATVPQVTINDFVTDTNTVNQLAHAQAQILSGSVTGAAAGDLVTITINNVDYTTVVDAAGNWSLGLPASVVQGLTDGTWTINVSVTDQSGNTGSSSVDVVVNTVTPVIGINTLAADDVINAAEKGEDLLLSGTSNQPEGTTITVNLNGINYTATTDASGNWSVTVPASAVSALGEANYTVTASVTDNVGNSAAATHDVLVDSSLPVVTINTLAGDNIVNAAEVATGQTLTGKVSNAASGDTVTIILGGQTYTATVQDDLTWSLPLTQSQLTALGNGDLTVSASVTNAHGNTGSSSLDVTIDAQLPGLRIDTVAGDDVINVIEHAQNLVISGTSTDLAAGSTVTVTINGKSYSASVLADGTWQAAVPAADVSRWADGSLIISASAQDTSGNPVNIGTVVDVDLAPVAISINSVTDDNVLNAAEKGQDLVLSGSSSNVEAGQTVTIIFAGKTWTTMVDANGDWTCTVPAADLSGLKDGDASVQVSVTNVNGNAASSSQAFSVDTAAPAVTINTISGDNMLNAAEAAQDLTLSGTSTAEAGQTVTVTFNGNQYTAQVQANGSWTLDVPAADLAGIADGSAAVTVTVSDKAGNPASAGASVLVDTTVPQIIFNIVAGDDIVNIAEHGQALIVTGKVTGAQAGDVITLSLNGKDYTAMLDASGNWSVGVPATDVGALANGDQTISATLTDKAGNSTSATHAFDVSLTTPVIAINTLAVDDVINATVKGQDLLISGTSNQPDGTRITVTLNGISYAATTDASGNWSVTVPAANVSVLGEASYSVTASVTDTAGNSANTSHSVLVDSALPQVTINAVATDDVINAAEKGADLVLSGSTSNVEENQTVTVTFGGKTYTAKVDADGNWTATVPSSDLAGLKDGDASVQVSVTNVNGNSASAGREYSVDATAPTVTIDTVAGDNVINGSEAAAGVAISGTTTAEVGQTVTVNLGGNSYTAQVQQGGVWSINVPAADLSTLADNGYTVQVSVSDAAGNPGSAGKAITLDTTPPTVSFNVVAGDDVINSVEHGQAQVISGTATGASVGDKLVITIGSNQYTTTVDASGKWSVGVPASDISALTDGTVTLSATITDSAGNSSTQTHDVVVNTASVALTVNTLSGDDVINAAEAGASLVINGSSAQFANGTQVTITLNGKSYTATIQSDGSWTTTVPAADVGTLADGASYQVSVSAQDSAGNSASATHTISVDTTAPVISVNTLSGDDVLNAAEAQQPLTVHGSSSAEAGQTVTVTLGGKTYTALVANDGTWTLDVPAADLANLSEGALTVTASVNDKAGNNGQTTHTLTVDTVAPAVTISTVADDDIVNNAEQLAGQTISGTTTAEQGQTVTVSFNGHSYQATVAANGSWSVFVPGRDFLGLSDGDYTITATVSDKAGNPGSATHDVTLNGDVPTIAINTFAQDDIVNAAEHGTPLVISGTTDAPTGQTVTITLNGKTYTATVQNDGTWSYTVGSADVTALADGGSYVINAQVSNAIGNSASDNHTVTVDLTAPSMGISIDSLQNDTGLSANDFITNDSQVVVNGSLTAQLGNNEKAQISLDGGTTWIDLTVTGTTWRYTDGRTLTDGTYQYQVRVIDNAGNVGATDSQDVVIDLTKPAAATITVDSVSQDTGLSDSDFITSDNQISLKGTLGAALGSGDHAQISLDGGATWTDVSVSGLSWTYVDGRTLADGDYNYQLRVIDDAGNISATTSQVVTIDTVAPDASKTIAIDSISDDTGLSSSDFITNDTSLTLHGSLGATLADGEYAQISIDGGVTWQNVIVTGNSWYYVDGRTLGNQTYDYYVRVVDAAGNVGASAHQQVTVDTVAPDAAITVTVDNITVDTGFDNNDFLTSSTSYTLNGTLGAELGAGEYVQVSMDGGTTWVYATVSGTRWSYNDTRTLADGDYRYQVRVVDQAGNVGATTTQDVTVDTQAPQYGITIDSISEDTGQSGSDFITMDTSLTINGSLGSALASDERVQISLDGGNTWIDTTVTNQRWSYTDTRDLADGDYTYQVRIIDQAGNVGSTSSQVVTVDTTPPDTVGTVVSYTDGEGERTGTYGASVATDDTSPLINGTLNRAPEDGEIVQLYRDGILLGQVTMNGSASWSYQDNGLLDGNHTYILRVTDKAGNYTESDGFVLNVDTSIPTTTAAITAQTTSDTTPIVSGTVSADLVNGEYLVVTVNGKTYTSQTGGAVVVDPDHNTWYLQIPDSDALSVASYDVTAQVKSSAGNGNTTGTATGSLVIDTTSVNTDWATTAGNSNNSTMTLGMNSSGLWNIIANGQSYSSSDDSTYAGNTLTNTRSYYVVSQTAADFDRNGTQDIFATENTYAGSTQVMWTYDGSSYTASQLAMGTTIWYGGVIAYDKTGDGYLDLAYGDAGMDSLTYLVNTNGVLSPDGTGGEGGFYGQFDSGREISGVDLNNDGTVDIVQHTNRSGAYSLTVINNNGNGTLSIGQNLTNVFVANASNTTTAASMTWADFNGDGYMDLYLGSSYNNNGGVIYYNDGTGQLSTTKSAVEASNATAGYLSVAVDWNGDGQMDIIKLSTYGSSQTATLFTNNGYGSTWTSSQLASGLANVTGVAAVDYNWDGAQDLLVSQQNGKVVLVQNNAEIADGTAMHLHIVDSEGINAYYGNTVNLYNAAGVLVASQIINAQSGIGSNDTSALVSFYGLDPNETYSAEIVKITNGVSDNVTWTGLDAGNGKEGYVLTAEAATGGHSGTITGTGYNDTFIAEDGTYTYNGSGGWNTHSDYDTWSNTGGMDVVDYRNATSGITVDLRLSTAQDTGFGTTRLLNIEGINGSDYDDVITGNSGDNQFEGRGGNDTFNIGSGGHDTLLYKLINASDATGGNGSDVVNGFTVGTWEGTADTDRIDLRDLLSDSGYTGTGSASYVNGVATLDSSAGNIADYIRVVQNGSNTEIQVDLDGTGGQFTPTTLVTLNGVQTDLATLLANHQLLIA